MERKRFLVCVDSDGCAMDTMDSKHKLGFGPQMVRSWNLYAHEKEALEIWNKISLYSENRGINRFSGLEMTMKECAARGFFTEDISPLTKWLEETKSFSNGALQAAVENKGGPFLEKVLRWSEDSNRLMKALPESQPFPGVKETLEYMAGYADLAVVSSANREAVEREWSRHGMIGLVKEVMAQDSGPKAVCIQKLLEEGYEKDRVIMLGDAPGDGRAAKKAGTLFYPIIIRREEECWKRLKEESFPRFLEGSYKGEYQDSLMEAFREALK